MSRENIALIIVFVVWFFTGLLTMIYSKAFIAWAIDLSTRNVKGPNDAHYTEGFRRANLWILRAIGLVLVVGGILALIDFLLNM
jgi:hypothetical protein